MATQVQFRRGTSAETASFIGASGEVTVDTTKHTCVVHDAVQVGGYPLLLENGSNSALAPGSLSSCALKFAGDFNTGIISPGADKIALVTGGVARLTIDTAGAITIPGNVSIAGSLTVTGAFNSTENIALIVALS
jgi:Major tropism determinant N-terminal domain